MSYPTNITNHSQRRNSAVGTSTIRPSCQCFKLSDVPLGIIPLRPGRYITAQINGATAERKREPVWNYVMCCGLRQSYLMFEWLFCPITHRSNWYFMSVPWTATGSCIYKYIFVSQYISGLRCLSLRPWPRNVPRKFGNMRG